jgi:hypothetical protein
MTMPEDRVEELNVSTTGVNIKNASISTIVSVIGTIGACVAVFLLWQHQMDAKAADVHVISAFKDLTNAIRESTSAQKEQTCMLRFEQKDRQVNAEFCKQMSR